MRKLSYSAGLVTILTLTSLMYVGSAFAAGPEPTGSFVCPVLGGQAGGDHGNSAPQPIVTIPSGSASVLGPDVNVPIGATNDDGAGNPASHVSPGDPNYSPIWWDRSGPPGTP